MNSAPFVLLPLAVDTDRVVLHTAEDVVITFVVYPRNGAGKACVQRRLLGEFKGIGVSEGCFRVGECECGRKKEQDFGRQFHCEVEDEVLHFSLRGPASRR